MIVALVDDSNHCHFLHCATTKSQRGAMSMLAGDVYTFSQGYDYGVSMRMVFESMKINVPLETFTKSKCIFDAIIASKRMRELCLMNNIADICLAY